MLRLQLARAAPPRRSRRSTASPTSPSTRQLVPRPLNGLASEKSPRTDAPSAAATRPSKQSASVDGTSPPTAPGRPRHHQLAERVRTMRRSWVGRSEKVPPSASTPRRARGGVYLDSLDVTGTPRRSSARWSWPQHPISGGAVDAGGKPPSPCRPLARAEGRVDGRCRPPRGGCIAAPRPRPSPAERADEGAQTGVFTGLFGIDPSTVAGPVFVADPSCGVTARAPSWLRARPTTATGPSLTRLRS